jgi:restriction system protein
VVDEEAEESVEIEGPDVEPSSEQLFHIERHLQDFLWSNWENTELASEWERYTEEGSPDAGYEYPCGVGRIDLLARHKTRADWLVIELKRNQTSDQTVGQILRYIGWVRQNLAEPEEEVKGLIIVHDVDERLQYALSVIPNVDLQQYEIDFRLRPVARMGAET